ncbi:MAG: exo-alpha-sialidase, partial [Victivallales bacterium]|nr:exo-alpha-sialidase [Victivallales bacterium]
DPQLWTDPDGCLWWFWEQDACNDYLTVSLDLRRGVWACRCENPSADELEWEPPKRLCDGTIGSKPKVLADGSWCFVTYQAQAEHGQRYDSDFEARTGINFYRSKDKLATITHVSTVCPPHRNYCDECDFTETSPGELWLLFRADYGPGEAFSHDNGATWTTCAPSSLRGADSRVTLTSLPDGQVMAIYNALSPVGKFGRGTPRKNLTAAFSKDNGRTWHKSVVIDPRLKTSYPSVAQLPDGTVWVAYDYARSRRGEIRVAKIKGDEVTANYLVNRTNPVGTAEDVLPAVTIFPLEKTDAPLTALRLSNGKAPVAATEFLLQYSQKFLRMTFFVHEPDTRPPFSDERVFKSDCLDIYLAPDPANPRRLFQLLRDMNGRTTSYMVQDGSEFLPVPDPFSATSERTADGWKVTLDVPWNAILCDGPRDLRGNLFRRRYAKQIAPSKPSSASPSRNLPQWMSRPSRLGGSPLSDEAHVPRIDK